MSENLNYNIDSSFIYQDIARNSDIYGRLYLWSTACNECPSGWHLPSDDEWKELEFNLGMDTLQVDSGGNRFSEVACKLKAIDTTYWHSPNYCATNESGFSAIPGGYYTGIRANNYSAIGINALYWTSTGCGWILDGTKKPIIYTVWIRRLAFDSNEMMRTCVGADEANSVRCIKNK